MLTTKGFRDIIELRRGMRIGLSPYNLKVAFPEPLVPRALRIGIQERVGPDGTVHTPLKAGRFSERSGTPPSSSPLPHHGDKDITSRLLNIRAAWY